MSEQEQDPKRWFADGFGGRWNVSGELAAKLYRKHATLTEAREVVEFYLDATWREMAKELDLEALESFTDDQIKAECDRRGIDFPYPEAPDV